MNQQSSPLSGKVLWITGASSGIGEALARHAAKTGAILALSARRAEVLGALVAELEALGASALAVPLDVTDRDAVFEANRQITERLGPVDVLVANAGTHQPDSDKQFDSGAFKYLMEINFYGVLYCIEAVLPAMRARRSGHLVCVSSLVGYRGLPTAAAYGSTKAALIHLTESLRFDLEPEGIDVTVVTPGFVRTPLTDRNTFRMPCLMEVEPAAAALLRGIERKAMQVSFPSGFAALMKLLRLLPYGAYHRLIKTYVRP